VTASQPVPTGLLPAAAGAVSDLLILLRPRQWAKNAAVALALLDSPRWSASVVLRTGWAALLFTLASGLVYVMNDIADRRLDANHPVKCHRPIASGRLGLRWAVLYACALAGLLVTAALAGPRMPLWPLAGYILMNLAYSRALKHVPIVDICVVSAGFVLRLLQGYAGTGGHVSGWLATAVLTACLALVLGKRRQELAGGTAYRPALSGYNLALTDHLLASCATLAVAAFLLYLRTDAPVGSYHAVLLAVATPLSLFGMLRYLQAVLVQGLGADPVATLLRDRLILGAAGLLAGAVLVAAALSHHVAA
jgi:decaprenyl-phosphate phosphoribosyltransferase